MIQELKQLYRIVIEYMGKCRRRRKEREREREGKKQANWLCQINVDSTRFFNVDEQFHFNYI